MTNSCDWVELHYQDTLANSDKYYRAYIWEDAFNWHVVFNWGRKGSKGQFKSELFADMSSALNAFEAKVLDKRDKGGYFHVGNGTLPQVPEAVLQAAGASGVRALADNDRSQVDAAFDSINMDLDLARRKAMGDTFQQAEAFTLRATLKDQLAQLKQHVDSIEGNLEILDVIIVGKVATVA